MKSTTRRFGILIAGWLLTAGAPATAGESNFPIPPGEAERRLHDGRFEILESERTAAGIAGAQKMKIRFDDGLVLKVKWKEAPRYKTDANNNSPRRELGAYEVQKLFLAPEDYVVPTSAARCIPLDQYDVVVRNAQPTITGTNCVFGLFSLWLQNVEPPDNVWDEELYNENASYRYHMSNMNILAFLVKHQDGRKSNWLVSKDDTNLRVFSIDNGISFGSFFHNYFVPNYDRMRVPAVPAKTIDRLRKVRAEDIDALGVMGHFEPDADGNYQAMQGMANIQPRKGARVQQNIIQFGLRDAEIKSVKKRLSWLLTAVDAGDIPTF